MKQDTNNFNDTIKCIYTTIERNDLLFVSCVTLKSAYWPASGYDFQGFVSCREQVYVKRV